MSTLTQRDIEVRVMKVVTDELKLNVPFDLSNRLMEDLGADSLDLTEIGMAIEEEFDIEVCADDNIKFETAADIVECVKVKLGA